MQAALRLDTANDNLPYLPIAQEGIAPASPSVTVPQTPTARDTLAAILIAWSLPIGAVAGLFPGSLDFTSIILALTAAALTAHANRVNSRTVLGMATLVMGLSGAMVVQGGVSDFEILVWPLSFGILWFLQAFCAVRLRSPLNAAALSGALAFLVFAIAGSILGLVTMLSVGLGLSSLYLGIARAGSKAKLPTLEVHYVSAWLLTVVCATGLAVLGAPILGAEGWIMIAAFVFAGVAVWAAQGFFPATQAISLVLIALLFFVPSTDAAIQGALDIGPGISTSILLGAAVLTSAGIALCARGISRDSRTTLLIGFIAAFATMLATARGFHTELEALGMYVLAGTLMTAWLLTARFS